MGHKNAALIGFAIVISATVGMALTSLLENDKAFLYTSIFMRLIQGMGDMWI
jgi:hypothetical protein